MTSPWATKAFCLQSLLESLSSLLAADLAWYYYWARRYDEAITTSREVLPSEPGFASAQSCIVRSLVAQKEI
jgi:hypothetical protein